MSVVVVQPVEWRGDAGSGALWLLDQRVLPQQETWVRCGTVAEAAAAIRDMVVRGAPAIGVAAAYAMVLAAQQARTAGRGGVLEQASRELAATRPTAVNLFWALEQCARRAKEDPSPEALLVTARAIHEADVAGNRRMGALGATRLAAGGKASGRVLNVLTHCNAGSLATGGFGTALGVIFSAVEQGQRVHVWVDETRPRLQGARLTAFELTRAGVPCTLICDNMAASLMAKGRVDACVTGADRIAANGDAANKIGTYSVAVNAKHHGVPFYVAAPASTFDLAIADGRAIPIEERASTEVTHDTGGEVAPKGVKVFNPGFDVTPASLISAIFTDRGEISPVTTERVAAVVGR